MNHIITYNEAIRWYKNGKIEPFKDIEEPIVEKDLLIVEQSSNFFLLNMKRSKINYKNTEVISLSSFEIFDNKVFDHNIIFNITSKIDNYLNIIICSNYKYYEGTTTTYKLKDLPIEIKERIINI